ncbi:MAG: hypothetical protein A2136_02205 [Chloroflexi bacterium RBG_16_54_11]|nr:MAG: hypothetical protein A2136_02205 [Chloroflexi bacterium RBG_16_54_11]
MKYKKLIIVTLFLVAALLSAWISPALGVEHSNVALNAPENAMSGSSTGQISIPKVDSPDEQIASLQAVITLLLWEEDTQVYLPMVRR